MRYCLLAVIVFGIVIFLGSLHDSGTRAVVEAVVAGLLVGTALMALIENLDVRRDPRNNGD